MKDGTTFTGRAFSEGRDDLFCVITPFPVTSTGPGMVLKLQKVSLNEYIMVCEHLTFNIGDF